MMDVLLVNLLPFVIIMGAMYFLMIRPQKKQQEKKQSMLDSMQPGNYVVTIGGLHGIVDEVNKAKRTVVLDCEGIFLEYDRVAIKTVKPGTIVANDTVVTPVEEPVEPKDAETAETVEVKEEITTTVEEPEDHKEVE